jgi:hypothetical protein
LSEKESKEWHQLIGHQPDGLFLFIFVECRRQVLLHAAALI